MGLASSVSKKKICAKKEHTHICLIYACTAGRSVELSRASFSCREGMNEDLANEKKA